MRTYFSLLGEDLLAEITGFALSKARQTKEEAAKLVNLFFSDNSPFTGIVEDLFHVLTVNSSSWLSCIGCHLIIDYKLDPSLNKKILEKCKKSLKKIRIADLAEVDRGGNVCTNEICSFMDLLVSESSTLQQLQGISITGDLGCATAGYTICALARSICPQLLELELTHTDEHEEPIPFTSLARNCTSLRRFRYTGASVRTLLTFWPFVGGTLEAVCIETLDANWIPTIASISACCRQLKSIELDNPFSDVLISEAIYRDFLISYGAQLREVDVKCLSADSLRLVAEACPNMRCTMYEMENEVDRISNLGKNLHTLFIRIDNEENCTALSEAMSEAVELHSLFVDIDVGIDVLYLIFEGGALKKLEELDLLFRTAVLRNTELECITNTGQLRQLEVRTLRIEKGSVFQSILRSNPSIEQVHLEELDTKGREPRQVIPFIEDLLAPFLTCSKLVTFSLRTYTTELECLASMEKGLQTCLYPMRRKRVDARVLLAVVPLWPFRQ